MLDCRSRIDSTVVDNFLWAPFLQEIRALTIVFCRSKGRGGREGGREEVREVGREGMREGGRERGREGVREGGRERGTDGRTEGRSE